MFDRQWSRFDGHSAIAIAQLPSSMRRRIATHFRDNTIFRDDTHRYGKQNEISMAALLVT